MISKAGTGRTVVADDLDPLHEHAPIHVPPYCAGDSFVESRPAAPRVTIIVIDRIEIACVRVSHGA